VNRFAEISKCASLPFGGQFDGVACSAVMMHLPETQLANAWQSMRSVLNPGGRVLISMPRMRPDLLTSAQRRRPRTGRTGANVRS
jgi:SAM-dependent methyltransferase